MTDDWFEAMVALLDADARFLVVGAHAMADHGVPRGTQDLDIWIDPSPDNARRVWQGLAAFGAPLESLDLGEREFTVPDTFIQLGLPPKRIDILTTITGVPDFASAWRDKVVHAVRGRPIPFLGRKTLVQNKRATSRPKDLADLDALGETTAGEDR